MTAPGLADALRAQIRSAHETAHRARQLLALTRTRLENGRQARRAAAGQPRGTASRARHRLTCGNEPLGQAALVALTRCGHWWVYPVRADAEQMHELARFNLGITCSFCLAAWHDATHARACGTLTRVN